MEDREIIEINGIKMEVDMRTAKTTKISTYKVGDQVKILVKDYSSYKSYPGVIVGFDNYQKLPTIVVAYLDIDYSSANIKMAYINEQSKENYELVRAEYDIPPFEKNNVIEKLDREINTTEEKLADLKVKRQYFIDKFNNYFEE